MNNETQKTSSILQRLPVILAVTAASYGLQVPPQALRLAATTSVNTVSRDGGGAPRLPGPVVTRTTQPGTSA